MPSVFWYSGSSLCRSARRRNENNVVRVGFYLWLQVDGSKTEKSRDALRRRRNDKGKKHVLPPFPKPFGPSAGWPGRVESSPYWSYCLRFSGSLKTY